ncbi:MAG: helix-turn-helix transcriptional regulator [Bacilli bacterium]|nr:helix-turn-helix transcriptional regulator [Bacilli bacterium]
MGNLGNNLFNARRKAGMSQEVVAEKLGVSRQTISKWETGETIPDIYQSKKLSILYHLSLDDLIEFDVDLKKIEQIIENTDEKQTDKIDWTKAWSKKYSVLACYQQVVDVDIYASKIRIILNELKEKYNYSDLDSMLVLKDILYHEWKDKK